MSLPCPKWLLLSELIRISGGCFPLIQLTSSYLSAGVGTPQMDIPGGDGPEKMGYKYQWTMSPLTSGCIAVGGIVSNNCKPNTNYYWF